MNAFTTMSDPRIDQAEYDAYRDEKRERDGLPTHIPVQEEVPAPSHVFGAILSFIGIILLALILRLAVPMEDSAFELAVLLIAVGFAQIWLIFNLLKSIRK